MCFIYLLKKWSFVDFQIRNERRDATTRTSREIRFYLHKEFRAAGIQFHLHKEIRAAGIQFHLHKEIRAGKIWYHLQIEIDGAFRMWKSIIGRCSNRGRIRGGGCGQAPSPLPPPGSLPHRPILTHLHMSSRLTFRKDDNLAILESTATTCAGVRKGVLH